MVCGHHLVNYAFACGLWYATTSLGFVAARFYRTYFLAANSLKFRMLSLLTFVYMFLTLLCSAGRANARRCVATVCCRVRELRRNRQDDVGAPCL